MKPQGDACEAERHLFPLPPAVQFWLEPPDEREDCDEQELESEARKCLRWLKPALQDAHRSDKVKAVLSDLLNVGDFTKNLGVFGVFNELRSFCQEAANDVGSKMKTYYHAASLFDSLGHFQAKCPREWPVLRQDDPPVGVPAPPRFTGQTPLQREHVVLHMLILLAKAVDPLFQAAMSQMARKHGGRHRGALTKSHARMANKAVSLADYRLKPPPVVMHNIDLVRCAATFDNVDDMKSMLVDLEDTFGSPARDKNMFAYSDAEAAENLHYRTFMRNIIFAPAGLTFGKLATDNRVSWEQYLEGPPEDPNEPWSRFRQDAQRAIEFLRSEEIAGRPVRLVCEVQCLLQKYLEGRLAMHVLYKVVRAPDERALYTDWRKRKGASMEGVTWTGVQESALATVRRWVDDEQHGIDEPWGDGGMTMLLSKAHKGHIWAVKWLLSKQASIDLAADDGATPLYLAAEKGHLDVVQVLVSQRARVDKPTTSSRATPLSEASSRGDINVVQLLLTARAAPDTATSAGLTPLWLAANGGHKDVVQQLLEVGASVNRTCAEDAGTPLFATAQGGYVDVASVLLTAAADVHQAKADDQVTPLSMAAFQGHEGMVAILLDARADVDAAALEGQTPLYVAAENGHLEVVQLLLAGAALPNKATSDDGTSPLYVAAQNGHMDVVEAMLKGKADVNQRTLDDGASPLWAAAESGHSQVVELLLSAHATTNISLSTDGSTPLIIAAYAGHAEVVGALLKCAADPCKTSKLAGTATQAALNKGHAEVAALLQMVSGQDLL